VVREEHFVKMPFIARAGTPTTELIDIPLAKLPPLLANGFIEYK